MESRLNFSSVKTSVEAANLRLERDGKGGFLLTDAEGKTIEYSKRAKSFPSLRAVQERLKQLEQEKIYQEIAVLPYLVC